MTKRNVGVDEDLSPSKAQNKAMGAKMALGQAPKNL